MIGYLLFGLTVTVYILLSIFALQPAPSGGDQTVGWAYSAILLLAAYTLCSLLLTVNITANGGFNWISDAAFKRNAGVAVLWLGVLAGVAYCILERTQYHKFYQLTGFIRFLSCLIFYGAAWLPLLMLIPYFLFLKEAISPNLFKICLVLAAVAGFLLALSPKIMSGIVKSYKAFDERELAFNAAMSNIDKYQDVMSLLYYSGKEYDERIRNAALGKIKANKNLEAELIDVFEQRSAATCLQAYAFLEENKTEHPERFINPIIKSFDTITAEMKEGIVNPYKGGAFDVGPLLRLLDEQFGDNIAAFKPKLLKLQETMDTRPAKNRFYGGTEEANASLNKYREEIKTWLDQH